jgi:hypothetical protein
MAKGFNVNADCSTVAACLAKDYEFVGRYYGTTKRHPLTLEEAKALSAHNLFLVAVWESGFPTSASYFSFAKGVNDGTSAYHYAQQDIGQPNETAIYFAVDYDASETDIAGVITEYFKGIKSGFEAISQNNPAYVVGVYGSGLTCSQLLGSNLVEKSWLAESTGWRDYHNFQNPNIRQTVAPNAICGLQGELDESDRNVGGFKIT